MTDNYFFDTDCLSAFLWVRNESILTNLYSGRIVLPMQVYEEIKKVPPLLRRVKHMIDEGTVILLSIDADTEEFEDYFSLAIDTSDGNKIIGKGEAAAIALAKKYNGILASNNIRDIMKYVEMYKLKHIDTGHILVEALEKGLITEDEGNTIWAEMLRRRRMLPSATFTQYLTKIKTTVAK